MRLWSFGALELWSFGALELWSFGALKKEKIFKANVGIKNTF